MTILSVASLSVPTDDLIAFSPNDDLIALRTRDGTIKTVEDKRRQLGCYLERGLTKKGMAYFSLSSLFSLPSLSAPRGTLIASNKSGLLGESDIQHNQALEDRRQLGYHSGKA